MRKKAVVLKIILWSIFIAVPFSSVSVLSSQSSQPAKIEKYYDQEAYAIISILFEPIIKGQEYEANVVIFWKTTQGPSKNFFEENCLKQFDAVPEEYEEIVQDFKRENQKERLLKKKILLTMPYRFISREEAQEFRRANYPPESGTPARKKKFRGYLEVSAVGFNKTRTLALAYVGHDCGSLCGSGTYYVLEKKEEQWQVRESFGSCGWVA